MCLLAVVSVFAGKIDPVVQGPVAYADASRLDDSGDGTSWATAKKTIQAAVDATTEGGTVWVTNGIYAVGGAAAPDYAQMNRVCIERPMTVRSVNGPDVTTIVGAAGSNGSNDVDSVRGVCITTNATLTGFTVSGGYTIPDGTYSGYAAPGAGVWLSSDAVVSNCTISGNSTLASGGGVYLSNGGLLIHSKISGNHAEYGGGGVCLNYGGTMTECVVSGNSEVWNGGGGVTIEGNGGKVNRCVIRDNISSRGAGAYLSYGGELNNCLVTGNIASDAGGGVSGSQCVLNNCTITGNSVTNESSGDGGGFTSGMGMAKLNNCIVWGNTSSTNPNLALQEGMDTVLNSCAPAGEGITDDVNGCVTRDPLFMAAGNYQLQAASPCVNKGDNAYAPTGLDLAGNDRVVNTTVDMGAYEQSTILPSYIITTTWGANGTISPTNPPVIQGADQYFSVVPVTGYRVDTILVDDSSVTPAESYTFTDVQAAHTIAATFVIDPQLLNVESGSGDGSYTNGAVVSVSADPAANGTRFSDWSVTPTEYEPNFDDIESASTTFTMPDEAVTISANYDDVVEVKNVSVAQRPGTKLVDISYDLFFGSTNSVCVSLAINNAAISVSTASVSGDVGPDISTGAGKSMLWDAGADWNGQVADLSFTVEGAANDSDSYSDTEDQSVDSRNYTLTVSSTSTGGIDSLSHKGKYSIDRSYGTVNTYDQIKSKGSESAEHTAPFYISRSVGPFMMRGDFIGMERGETRGFSSIKVDSETGTLKASAVVKNTGGPKIWIDDDGDSHTYSALQSWGTAESRGGARRLYEVTGSASFELTLSEAYEGTFEVDETTTVTFQSVTHVTRIKDEYAFFNRDVMSWGAITDLAVDTNSYDWVYGEDQEVAEFLVQTGFEENLGTGFDLDRSVSGQHGHTFTVNPGDLILLEDWISVTATAMNPRDASPGIRNEAWADDFILTSELSVAGGSDGAISGSASFDGEPLGNPVPAIGTHSNYCWMSTVTPSVDPESEGYQNIGWLGSGSVPASGSTPATGPIVLSNLNSTIDWQWSLEGYELTVEDGTGSGVYTNGDIVSISADPVGFYQWSGDYAGVLDDPTSPSTSLRMPRADVVLTPVYHPTNIYVDASMPDDSLDGRSWATAKQTIQAAVDTIALDGTVWVTNGVYDVGGVTASGSTLSNRVCITRSMTVRSMNGANETTVAAGGIRGAYLTNGCSLIGFTIQDGDSPEPGGGVLLYDGCVVENCIIQNNATDAAGGGVEMIGGTVNNCLIVGNSGNTGAAGVYMTGGALKNSTVASNGAGGGVAGGGEVYNCIMWGNSTRDLLITTGVVSHTCSSDGIVNNIDGCITDDPQFVDAANGDYELQSNSPCIDQGDNTYAPVADGLGGQARVINGIVDMGAYERFIVEEDTDIDGVPDWWELRHFGGVTNAPALQLSSNGVDTVRQAYIAGLDPQNPESKFVAQAVRTLKGKPLVKWPVTRGRIYSVYWSPDLATGFTLLKANIPWTQEGFEDEAGELDEMGFYKIKVQLED